MFILLTYINYLYMCSVNTLTITLNDFSANIGVIFRLKLGMKVLKDFIAEANELVSKISCKEFAENKERFFIVDVREPSEIQETGSIDDSLNIPRGLLEMKLAPDPSALHADSSILVYCGGGSRAALAGRTLMELGFTNVKNLEGGFRGWKKFSG